MSIPSQARYQEQLGMSLGKANAKLWKQVIWSLLVETTRTLCFRCGYPMAATNYSLDHAEAWRGGKTDAFWRVDNVKWSHRDCNSKARRVVVPTRVGWRYPEDGLLWCPVCALQKPVAEFTRLRSRRHGYADRCRLCVQRVSAESRRTNGRSVPADKHGTVSAYETYGCRCAPCRKASSEYRKAVNTARAARRNSPILA